MKTQLVTTQLRTQQGLTDAGHREGAADLLKTLLQAQSGGYTTLMRQEVPFALHLRRNDPHKSLLRTSAQSLVGGPFLHVKCIRDDARTRPHLQQCVAKLQVQLGQQIHGHHRGFAEVLNKNVAANDLDHVSHARLLRILLGKISELGVVLDPHGTRLELLCSRDRDHPIARTQVIDDIFGGDLRCSQHLVDHVLRGGQPHHILAGLAQHWFETSVLLTHPGATRKNGDSQRECK